MPLNGTWLNNNRLQTGLIKLVNIRLLIHSYPFLANLLKTHNLHSMPHHKASSLPPIRVRESMGMGMGTVPVHGVHLLSFHRDTNLQFNHSAPRRCQLGIFTLYLLHLTTHTQLAPHSHHHTVHHHTNRLRSPILLTPSLHSIRRLINSP